MNITVFRQEEGKRFLIKFEDGSGNRDCGFGLTLDVEDVRTLNEKLSAELEDLDKSGFREEIVWNPRSQRHEKVRR